jgi:hypothetical protein
VTGKPEYPQRRIQETSVSAPAIPRLLAENQFGGAARDHVSRRVCPRPRDDPRHHGGVCHAQTNDPANAKLGIDDGEIVYPNFAGTNGVSKAR